MMTTRSMLAALPLMLLGHEAASAATTSPPVPPPGSPVALAQDMIQAARHDMIEAPAEAEQVAREFGAGSSGPRQRETGRSRSPSRVGGG